jgi:hypothetical protein
MTKASLIDSLAKAKSTVLPPSGSFFIHHSLNIAAEELGVLMPAYDMEFVGTLNALWNNKTIHREVRRTGSKQDVSIEMPSLNILGGCQPAWLASVFPPEAWDTGISRRLLMIYGASPPWKDVWSGAQGLPTAAKQSLLASLGELSVQYGQMDVEPEVISMFSKWDKSGQEPKPTHSKLVHYLTTRYQTLMKLCIISAASRRSLAIEEFDLTRAMDWLFEAEVLMPDAFRAMLGKSDRDIINELHIFAMALYTRGKNKPIPGESLRRFLLDRLPHDKIESMMNAVERANVIARSAGTEDMWVPRPRLVGGGAAGNE